MRFMIIVVAIVLSLLAGLWLYQKFSDGPTGPLTGGSFRSGEPAFASQAQDLDGDFEFELVGYGTSRTAGGIVVNDALYVTCDLGFVWNRLPSGMARSMLHVIWVFKDWHEKAQEDGRIRIRKNNQIYAGEIQLVEDAAEIEALKVELEDRAKEFFGGHLGPRPAEPPNDIVFFRASLEPNLE